MTYIITYVALLLEIKKQPRQVGESSKLMVSTHQALQEGQFVGLLLGIIYIWLYDIILIYILYHIVKYGILHKLGSVARRTVVKYKPLK